MSCFHLVNATIFLVYAAIRVQSDNSKAEYTCSRMVGLVPLSSEQVRRATTDGQDTASIEGSVSGHYRCLYMCVSEHYRA